MAGIRIRAEDDALANKTLEIEHHTRHGVHGPKTYRLALDETAAVIVSPVVWERIQEVMAAVPACPRFAAVGDMAHPPAQYIGGRPARADLHFSPSAGLIRPNQ